MSDAQDQFELDLPDGLVDGLRGAYGHRLDILPRVDQAILAAARGKFDHRRKLKLWVRWGAAITSAAAAIVLVLLLLPPRPRANQLANTTTKTIKGDIDASGQLDIVDAMALARYTRAGDAPNAAWDVNGDSTIDQRDVDALAAAAVSLKQQGVAARRLPSIDQLGLAAIAKFESVQPNQRDVAVLDVQPEERQ